MGAHAKRQRSDAAEGQPRVKGTWCGAEGVGLVADTVDQLSRAGDDSAYRVAMAGEVLGRGMEDEVSSIFERPEDRRGQERVVNDEGEVRLTCDRGQRADIGEVHVG